MVNPDLPHSASLRRGRSSEPGARYLVTKNRSARCPLLLTDPRVAPILTESIRWHHEHGHARLLAFVVMPDHVHWAFALAESRPLGEVMLGFAGYTWHQVVPVLAPESRTIWEEEYHDRRLHTEEAVWEAIRYVHGNPVKEGLCARAEEWAWSTANERFRGWVELRG